MFLNDVWLSFIDILKKFKTCRVARSMKLNLYIPNWERFHLLSLFLQLPLFQGEEGDPLKPKAANLVGAVPWGIKAPSFQVKSHGPGQPWLSHLLFLSSTLYVTYWTFVVFVKFQRSLTFPLPLFIVPLFVESVKVDWMRTVAYSIVIHITIYW